jgi:hypothetical protein
MIKIIRLNLIFQLVGTFFNMKGGIKKILMYQLLHLDKREKHYEQSIL